jgi:hypothetical protein
MRTRMRVLRARVCVSCVFVVRVYGSNTIPKPSGCSETLMKYKTTITDYQLAAAAGCLACDQRPQERRDRG